MNTLISRLRVGTLVALGLVCAGIVKGQPAFLYGVTFFNNELITVDTATGAGTFVATLSQPVSPYGIAYRGSNLYTFDSTTDRIRQINPLTGAVSGSINIGIGDLTGEGDLAFRSDGMGFISSALTPAFGIDNGLYRFDLTLGTSVRVGTTSVVLDGMVFVGNTLYGIGQESVSTLYTVNQTTAALTAVGALGLEMDNPFGALTVGPNGGLFGAVNDRLYSINMATGHATELSPTVLDIGYSSVSGLAAPAPSITPVPEPATYGVAGAAVLIMAGFVRRLRRRTPVPTACA